MNNVFDKKIKIIFILSNFKSLLWLKFEVTRYLQIFSDYNPIFYIILSIHCTEKSAYWQFHKLCVQHLLVTSQNFHIQNKNMIFKFSKNVQK